MTTAELRIEARNAEQNLNWKLAAELYTQAVASYPKSLSLSSLAQVDLANLTKKAAGCFSMAAL